MDGGVVQGEHEELFTEGLLAQLREDIGANGGLLRPGAQAVVVHRVAQWGRERAPRWARSAVRIATRLGFVAVRNLYGIELPHTVALGRRVHIGHQSGIVVHPRARIGDGCVLRQGVTLGAAVGGTRFAEQAPTLGRGVSVGAGAVVMGAVTVGDGARIGPNATVITNVPAGARVMAPPPRTITLPTDVAERERRIRRED